MTYFGNWPELLQIYPLLILGSTSILLSFQTNEGQLTIIAEAGCLDVLYILRKAYSLHFFLLLSQ